MKKTKRIKLESIDLIVYDFDGVMTNNKVLVFEDGKEAVFCNRADGLAISKINDTGIPQIILSTEENNVVTARAKKLGIKAIQGISNKKDCLVKYCKKKHYALKKVIYIGNDTNDLEAMKCVGYPLAPQDASSQIKKIAMIVFSKKGGEGVVRAFLDII